MAKILRFRRLKHGSPRKLKVLSDHAQSQSSRRFAVLTAFASIVAFSMAAAAASGVISFENVTTLVPRETYDPQCNVKGNISINSGEKIYHVPGQEYYDVTNISPEHGERWFCSEAEASAAGWRRAKGS